jgi:hypothetical protein
LRRHVVGSVAQNTSKKTRQKVPVKFRATVQRILATASVPGSRNPDSPFLPHF